MNVRFSLDPQLDVGLIEKIEERANGGSLNRAAYLLLVEWSALENDRNMTPGCQNGVKMVSKSDTLVESDDFDLRSFEDAFDDM